MILPITDSPLTSYHNFASLLSVVLCAQDGRDWYHNNFVQLFTCFHGHNHGEEYRILFREELFSYERNSWAFYYDYNPFISEYAAISDYTIFSTDIIGVLKKLLNQKFYVSINIDSYYLSEATYKTDFHRLHGAFIYGYDDMGFLLLEFDTYGFHKKCHINYDDLVESYSYQQYVPWYMVNKEKLIMFKLEDATYEFDTSFLMHQLTDYIESRNTLDAYEFEKNMRALSPNKVIYGIGIYDYITEDLVGGNKKQIDIRNLSVIVDHKKAMVDRIVYMIEKKKIDDDNLLSYAKDIYKMARILLSLSIKYNLTQKRDILNTIVEKINELAKNEQELIYDILCHIK